MAVISWFNVDAPTPSTSPRLPTPVPSPLPQDVTWADAMSAYSELAAAVGTVLSLVFIAVTVRQQGKALGLQIDQLQAEREQRAADRQRAAEVERQQRAVQARRVKAITHEIAYDPGDEYFPMTATGLELVLAEEMQRRAGNRPWDAAAIEVKNDSDMVIRNVTCRRSEFPRAQYIWRKGSTSLLEVYELEHLSPGNSAFFVWLDRMEAELHVLQPDIEFFDEGAGLWRTDLTGHTARIDDLKS